MDSQSDSWYSLAHSMTSHAKLLKPKQWIVSKFIHKWLSLETRYQVQSISTQQIYHVNNNPKWQNISYSHCPHNDQQQLWTYILSQLQKLSWHYNILPTLSTHIVQGIQTCTSMNSPPLPLDPTHPIYYQQQHWLGWHQILYRHYSSTWVSSLHHHDPPINGQHFLTKLTVLIWTQILAAWQICNMHLHPPNITNTDCLWLWDTVQILHKAWQHPHLEAMIGHIQIDQLMSRPTKQINQFVNQSESWSYLGPQSSSHNQNPTQYPRYT